MTLGGVDAIRGSPVSGMGIAARGEWRASARRRSQRSQTLPRPAPCRCATRAQCIEIEHAVSPRGELSDRETDALWFAHAVERRLVFGAQGESMPAAATARAPARSLLPPDPKACRRVAAGLPNRSFRQAGYSRRHARVDRRGGGVVETDRADFHGLSVARASGRMGLQSLLARTVPFACQALTRSRYRDLVPRGNRGSGWGLRLVRRTAQSDQPCDQACAAW